MAELDWKLHKLKKMEVETRSRCGAVSLLPCSPTSQWQGLEALMCKLRKGVNSHIIILISSECEVYVATKKNILKILLF